MMIAGLVAWLLGLLAYEAWLRLAWQQSMGSEWRAVAFWSGTAFVVVAPILYLPVMMLVRRIVSGYGPLGWFPLAASALGVVPTALIVFLNGGRLKDLFSPEAVSFYLMFGVVGAVFGLAYAWNRNTAA